jgi:Spy/CpxP family protein refolding chaperone
MKIKWISWLGSGLIISASTFPLIAQAQSNDIMTNLSPALAEIELSASQQTQLEAVKKRTQSQLQTILSSEQQDQLKNALSQGNDMRSAVQSLNLSFRQRRQMKNIMQTMRSQLNNILTPEQKQQIQQKAQSSRS